MCVVIQASFVTHLSLSLSLSLGTNWAGAGGAGGWHRRIAAQ